MNRKIHQFVGTLWILGLVLLCIGAAGCTREPDAAQTTSADAPAPPDSAVDADVPYVSTPQVVVDSMLAVAGVTEKDTVYDLGSGDGRIVIAAAKTYGARGVGIEIDPTLVQEARKRAEAAGVADRVMFRRADLFETDLSGATVVTLYLLPSVNKKLRPKLLEELRPGARVVSHAFDMNEWEPDRVVHVGANTVYLWTVPETVPAALKE